MRLPSTIAAAAASALLLVAQPNGLPALAAPPTIDATTTLRKGYQAAADGLFPLADTLLTKSIAEWQKTAQPADEVSALFKVRSGVRQQQGRNEEALNDLNEALNLLSSPSAKPGAGEEQRTYLQRARVLAQLQRWKEAEADYSNAIARLDQLDAIESTNPFLYSERSAARSRIGDFQGAADDALTATVEFKDVGDKLRSLLASSDAAVALYGSGEIEEGVARMKQTFTSYGNKSPATNNPDDIGTLQQLARREAELHLAYGAHLYGSGGELADAKKQWETGCIRLEAFIADAQQRQADEEALRAREARQAETSGKEVAGTLKAASVEGNLFNSPLIARLNGMDPESPFVTQRPNSGYIYYQTGEGAAVRRNPGVELARVDGALSCANYRRADWLKANKPEWPPALVANVEKYAAAVPQGPIVVPPKGAGLDRSQCSVLLSKPGLGDAVPCF